MAVSANSDWLDQFEEGNTAGGRAGEVETIPCPAVSPLMMAGAVAAFRRYFRRRKREIALLSASSASALRMFRASRKISTQDNSST